MMLISIIIPFYNSARYISRCLNSLLCQDLSNVEILCVDDGSTDNSSSIISNMIEQWNMSQHVHLVKLNQNSGVAHARNVGINTAKGDYVIFIDSDDYVSPDYIAVLKDAVIESEPDALIFNYFSWTYILSSLGMRLFSSILVAILCGVVVSPIVNILKQKRRFD